jgi:hypothetical protein
MEVHVLNGDALAGGFPFGGEIIICRECLIEGPVQASTLEEFWNTRASYLSDAFNGHGPSYFNDVSSELNKLQNQKPDAVINLWFEHDLFCQANLWFILHLLRDSRFSGSVYRVIPPTDGTDLWSGFGPMNEQDLEQCFKDRIRLSPDDLLFGASLWSAYQTHDLAQLKTLSIPSSASFPFLKEVCEAHIQRFSASGIGRPHARLKQIITSGVTDFNEIFKEFWKTEGIYGFGDLQVKNMLTELGDVRAFPR